jgi:hypothetical protein
MMISTMSILPIIGQAQATPAGSARISILRLKILQMRKTNTKSRTTFNERAAIDTVRGILERERYCEKYPERASKRY